MGSSYSTARHWTEDADDNEDVQSGGPVEPAKKIRSRPFSLVPSISRMVGDTSSIPASPTISPPLSSTFTGSTSKRTSSSSYWAASIPTSARFPKTPPFPTAPSPGYSSAAWTTIPPQYPPIPTSMSPQHPPSISPRNPPSYYHPEQPTPHRPPPISPRSLTSTTTNNTPLTSPFLPDTRIFRLDPSPTGGTVYAWPSSGGVLIAICTPCELAWLNISEASERFLDQAEEDDFCIRLRGLGAKRYPSIEAVGNNVSSNGNSSSSSSTTAAARPEEETIKVGYPENGQGVWIVRLGGLGERKRSREEHVEYLRTVAELRAARTMGERCEVIRRLGGMFFPDPSECEEIHW